MTYVVNTLVVNSLRITRFAPAGIGRDRGHGPSSDPDAAGCCANTARPMYTSFVRDMRHDCPQMQDPLSVLGFLG
jgi:hypothetical protein